MSTLATLLALAAGITPQGNAPAMALAQDTWGTPACGIPRIETRTPERYLQLHGTGNFETGSPQAWADETRCVIVINPDVKIRTAVKRCHVIVHEWGHLAGRNHSDDYRDVMYADASIVLESVQIDGKKRRWGASGAFRSCYKL